MSEIIVAYWSGTGNTGAMAEYVAQGIRAVSYTHLDVYKRQL